ncbi:MAG: ABC transporter permease [Phycisphaerales bacterium]
MSALPAFRAIASREIVRVLRQPSRIVAALGTPALIWAFFASGFARSVRTDTDAGYALFLLPGMVTLTATFSAIFSAISLIHDRREGFLQSAIVSPAPAWSIALGKALGCSVVAFVQAAALLLLAPLFTDDLTMVGFTLALLAAVSATLAVTGLGMALAWKVNSVEGFHGVMNLLLTPMWLLSGAVFDVSSASPWLAWLARLNPLTHVTDAMRAALIDAHAPPLAWVVTALFAAFGLAASVLTMARASRPGGANNHT